ncbi:hypothetical protein HG530_002221 [Fusarium avenaceum]|nr:hypothetical protein HG530_002221 [Fusarium avenaceum]
MERPWSSDGNDERNSRTSTTTRGGSAVAANLPPPAILHEVHPHVPVIVRGPVHFHSTDEGGVWFVHDDVAWFGFLKNMLVLVSVIRVDDNKVLHVVQLKVLLHIVKGIRHNFVFLLRLLFCDLYLCHEIGDFSWLLDILHDAAILGTPHACTDVTSTTHPSSLVSRGPSTSRPRKTRTSVRSAIESLLIFRKESGADLSELSLPLENGAIGIVASWRLEIQIAVDFLQDFSQKCPFGELFKNRPQRVDVIFPSSGLGASRNRIKHGSQNSQVVDNLLGLPAHAMPIRIQLSSNDNVEVLEQSTVKVPVVHFQAAVTFLKLVNADFNTLHDGSLNLTHRVRHRNLEFDNLGLLLTLQGLCDSNVESRPERRFPQKEIPHHSGQCIQQSCEKIYYKDARSDTENAASSIHLLPCADTLGVCVYDSQATRLGGHADGSMFSQCLSNPAVFSLISSDDNNQIITGRIVGVEEIVDKAHQPEATGDNDKLIFSAKLLEQVLLIFLETI